MRSGASESKPIALKVCERLGVDWVEQVAFRASRMASGSRFSPATQLVVFLLFGVCYLYGGLVEGKSAHTHAYEISWKSIFETIQQSFDEMVAFRRDIHMHPEIGLQEYRTSQKIKQKLKELGIAYYEGLGAGRHIVDIEELEYVSFPYVNGVATGNGTGIIADIGTGATPCIALRADMDALPIQETVNLTFKSQVDGVMHACGHDVHTTALLFAAKYLKSIEKHIPGTVRLIFQPGEEGFGGGLLMEREGVLMKYPEVQEIYGLHVAPMEETGTFFTRSGPIFAAANGYQINIEGKGGHAARPIDSINPIMPAVAIANFLTDVAAKETGINQDDSAVITVTSISSGNTHNVIDSKAKMLGTIRTLNTSLMKRIKQRLEDGVALLSKAYRCISEVIHTQIPYKVVYNDEKLYQEAVKVSEKHGLEFKLIPAMFAAEDFGFFSLKVPGFFCMFGTGNGTVDADGNRISTRENPHQSNFAVDEDALVYASTMHTMLALEALTRLSKLPVGSKSFDEL